ncbi:MAG: hypothetical protein IPH09_07175 [bacterium]|nr:hypothetical protein [bacterium]
MRASRPGVIAPAGVSEPGQPPAVAQLGQGLVQHGALEARLHRAVAAPVPVEEQDAGVGAILGAETPHDLAQPRRALRLLRLDLVLPAPGPGAAPGGLERAAPVGADRGHLQHEADAVVQAGPGQDQVVGRHHQVVADRGLGGGAGQAGGGGAHVRTLGGEGRGVAGLGGPEQQLPELGHRRVDRRAVEPLGLLQAHQPLALGVRAVEQTAPGGRVLAASQIDIQPLHGGLLPKALENGHRPPFQQGPDRGRRLIAPNFIIGSVMPQL